MTLGERVEQFSGTVSNKDWLSSLLSAGLRAIVDLIPEGKKHAHTKTVAMNATSGVALGEYNVVTVTRSGYRARWIPADLRAQAADTTSLHYATDTDPVFYFANEKAKGLPATGTWSCEVLPYQDVNYGDERIPNFPVEYEHLVILNAAISALGGKIEAEREALPSVSDVPVPDFAWTTVYLEDVEFFSSSFAKLAAYLDTAEDIELAMAKLQEINVRLEVLRLNAVKAHDAVKEEWAARLQKYSTEVGVALQKLGFLNGQLQALNAMYQNALTLAFGAKQ